MDDETYSEADLKKCGSWKYSEHPSTELLCKAYAFGGDEPKLWKPGDPDPEDLFAAIKAGKRIKAHGVNMERAIWENICVKRMGWPEIEPGQWYCIMGRAASRAMPLGLDQLSSALDLVHKKNKRGKQLIQLLAEAQEEGPAYPHPGPGTTGRAIRILHRRR